MLFSKVSPNVGKYVTNIKKTVLFQCIIMLVLFFIHWNGTPDSPNQTVEVQRYIFL